MAKMKPSAIEKLLLLRRRKGWTQEEAAKRLDVKPRTLRSWEQGIRLPKPIVLRAIEDFVEKHSDEETTAPPTPASPPTSAPTSS